MGAIDGIVFYHESMTARRSASGLIRMVVRRSLLLWCTGTILLLSLNGIVFYSNTRTLVDHDSAVTHTQEVLSALENLLTSVTDTETGERGYIITGDERYLRPYSRALAAIDPQMSRTDALTVDNMTQQRRLPRLRVLIAAKLTEEQLAISLRRTAGGLAVGRVVLSGPDQALMDDLRSAIAAMKDTELSLLARRSASAHAAAEATTATLIVASCADAVLLTSVFFLIQRNMNRSAQAAEERERLLRREQEAREQAEAAVHVRDTFLSLASHELKTPLTTLLGSSQLLQARFERQEDADARSIRLAGTISKQAERLRLLTEQMLDVSRLQDGQLAIRVEPVDLGALVRRVVEEVAPTAPHHPIEVVGAAALLPIAGDALRLEQALQNLLANAVKYSPNGGTITVELARAGDDAVVRVSDSGIGIPALAQAQLFRRFYRASNVNASGITSGLGIGLYVVHEIVERHGGTIAVESVEGTGSTFTIHLPLRTGALSTESAAIADPTGSSTG